MCAFVAVRNKQVDIALSSQSVPAPRVPRPHSTHALPSGEMRVHITAVHADCGDPSGQHTGAAACMHDQLTR